MATVLSNKKPAVGELPTPPNVSYVLPEVAAMEHKWNLIADCIAGQEAVKSRTTRYLPQPNAADRSDDNIARYTGYVARSVFYNVTANTLSGLVGQVFNVDPVSEYPDELEPLWYDANGRGVTLVQQSKKALSSVLAFGRCGILVDYPSAIPGEDGKPRPFTAKEVSDGIARPTIQYYDPATIINWRFAQVGAVSKLVLVVLVEDYILRDDGFEIKRGKECRVLRLDGEKYTVETWRRTDEKQEGPFERVGDVLTPTDASGAPFDFIPFYFIGAQNNDATIDKPPLYDMANLNIGHYRNSADYEDSVYMVGQPTPFFAGLTEHWVTEVLKGTVQLGSRAAVPLPEGGSAGLIQAEPNSMVKEAMDQKERQMVALGAQLVEEKQVQRTLGEAQMENAQTKSTLTSCANNVSQAFETALITAARFRLGEVNPEDITYKLSTDFAISKLGPEERKQLLTEWQGGAITFTEMRSQLRQSGIATEDDKEAQAAIEEDLQKSIDLDAKRAEALGEKDPVKPGEEKDEDDDEGGEE